MNGPQDVLAVELRAGPLHSRHDVQPQPGRVIIATVKGDKGKRPVLDHAGRPLSHRNRLAGTRGRGHQHQPGRRAPRQIADEVLALHPLLTKRGSVQLRFDQHAATRPLGHRRSNTRYRRFLRNASPGNVPLPGTGPDCTHVADRTLVVNGTRFRAAHLVLRPIVTCTAGVWSSVISVFPLSHVDRGLHSASLPVRVPVQTEAAGRGTRLHQAVCSSAGHFAVQRLRVSSGENKRTRCSRPQQRRKYFPGVN